MGSAWPSVSIIIPARNAAATLPACLSSLARIDYPHYDVIVADDGSSDSTAEIARRAGVRVIETGGRGPSTARNTAASLATSDLIAFTDADCTVPSHWLAALVAAAVEHPGVAGAGGSQKNIFPRARDGEALDAFFRAASLVSDYARRSATSHEVPHIASCNAVYRRDIFLRIGGLREGLFPGEDVDLDYRLTRAGHRLVYVPNVEIDHHRPGTRAWFRQWMYHYGRAQRELVREHGHFRPIQYLPMVFAGALGAQLLWAVPGLRPVIAVADLLLALGASWLVVRSGPAHTWPAVLPYGLDAVVNWHKGYLGCQERRTA